MKTVAVAIVAALLVVAAQLPLGIAFQSIVPAFLWSPHLDGMKEMIDYRTLSPRDLAKSVMAEGRWSNYLLQSVDMSRPRMADAALVDFLKDSFSNSNFSLAFPYVAASEEKVAVENTLMAEFADSCQNKMGINNIALMGSCLMESDNFDKLDDIHSVHDYVHSRMGNNSDGHTNLIVLCHRHSHSSQDSDQRHSESSILSKLLNVVEQFGAKYSVLYVSDPFRSIQPPSHQGLERFLAEANLESESSNSLACDGVCQIKSSLLEGILVAIVLLIILLSGLCCMMGIDTPTRFETPQDS
ncbi:uncharacterized protein LOC142541093 isoform X2 [Primulina tabacum]|uniref:uncharacterized protein LOC142541093 isoform X2 n=1 Tax=Primulina tabacum TaxID=48773 RepID=UPI003F59783D